MKTIYRYVIIAIVLLGAIYYLLPQNNNINLGLDLKGGMHVILGVQVNKAVEAKLNSIVSQLKRDLLDKSVDYAYIRKVGNKIEIALKIDSSELVKGIIDKNYPYFEISSWQESDKKLTLVLSENEAERIKNYAVDQALQVVRNRVDEFGVTEPVIQKQGQYQILVQLPGVTDPKRALELIGKTAQLEFYLVDEDIDMRNVLSGNIPPDDIVLYQKLYDDKGREINKIPYPLKRPPVLTGEYLSDAEVRISPQYNQPYVMIRFDAVGSKLFEEITSNNVGKKLAIVLDNQVYSAPVIREPIAGGIAQITGDFTMQEARDLAVVLRAGSLPAPVEILENRTVGPSLGRDSIESGIKAAIIALIMVIAFLAYYYKLAGIFANIA
ncbi:MAG: protein translocase subunit SecD, partial [Deferribacterota bacterium]|nr:protein translocase subunit SecD [Deferribacterota bacterium]